MSKRILVGKIIGAHGIKGLVKLVPMVEDITLLSGPLYTGPDGLDYFKITLKNPVGKHFLAAVDGITDRNAAEKLRCSLFVSRETLPETDDIYIDDLIGLTVMDASGHQIGTITSVANFGASDLLEIDNRYYIPLSDDFVTDIDLDAGTVTAQNYEQFRDL